jgi:hypothetical protein
LCRLRRRGQEKSQLESWLFFIAATALRCTATRADHTLTAGGT